MPDFWKKLTSKLSGKSPDAKSPPAPEPPPPAPPVDEEAALWQRVYDARRSWYTSHFGPLPNDILKIVHMTGVWPGGGLYAIPANVVKPGLWCYTTFGFSNPDMPTTTTMTNVAVEHDALGRPVGTQGTLQAKPRAIAPQGAAGYGYEFAVLCEENAEWPLWLLQWAASAELTNDVGMLARVEKYAGLTISDLNVGRSEPVHLLIARARPPLPIGADLPNGRMELLIATTISQQEMEWSFANGRDQLLDRLVEQGYGQISRLGRPSVV